MFAYYNRFGQSGTDRLALARMAQRYENKVKSAYLSNRPGDQIDRLDTVNAERDPGVMMAARSVAGKRSATLSARKAQAPCRPVFFWSLNRFVPVAG